MTVPDFIEVRGYAIAFNLGVPLAGQPHELIDGAAFDGMLATKARVPLLWDSHDGSAMVLASSTRLFADDYGIGFSASVDVRGVEGRRNLTLIRAIMQKSQPKDRCSIGDFHIAAQQREVIDGVRCSRVLQGSFGHITLCADAAYGNLTGVWPLFGSLDQAPSRIRDLAARWAAGDRIHKLRAERARLFADAERIVNGRGLGPGGDLSAEQVARSTVKMMGIRKRDHEIARLRRNLT